MKSLNILIINSSRKWIGEAARSMMVAEELARAGHSVWVGCRKGRELERRSRERDDIRTVPLTLSSRFNPVSDFRDMCIIRSLVSSNAMHIVHVHRGKEHWLAALALRGMRHRPCVIRTRHTVIPVAHHLFNKWLYKHATESVISVSNAAQKSLGSLIDFFPPVRSPIIYSAVDGEQFSPTQRSDAFRCRLGVDNDTFLVGLIARFQRIKGQRQFLEAAQRVIESTPPNVKIRFLLAGKKAQQYKERYVTLVDEMGIAEHVIFLDHVEHIPRLVASLDIGVCASLGSEGSSRIILEYMASGVPVIATTVGGVPELVVHEQTALLVEPGNVDALKDAVLHVLASPDLRHRLSQNGLKDSRERFGRERFLSNILSAYNPALNIKE